MAMEAKNGIAIASNLDVEKLRRTSHARSRTKEK